jgi:hypothetical protein
MRRYLLRLPRAECIGVSFNFKETLAAYRRLPNDGKPPDTALTLPFGRRLRR